MDANDSDFDAALEALERELDRMNNEGEIQQANELVAAICARFAIETAQI